MIVSYFQAGTICDFVSEKWGEGKLLDMVHSYAAADTPQAIQQDLGISRRRSSIKQYLAWIDKQYGAEAAALRRMAGQAEGAGCRGGDKKQYDTVLQQGPAVIAHVSASMWTMPTPTSWWPTPTRRRAMPRPKTRY